MTKASNIDFKAMRRHAGEAAAMLRMLSHEARLAVLCELVGGDRTAGELVACSGLSQSALSQHLAKLREQGLVATRRESQSIHYRLADAKAAQIIAFLHQLYCKGNAHELHHDFAPRRKAANGARLRRSGRCP